MFNSKISGLGYYVPDNIVTNHDLSEMMDTNDRRKVYFFAKIKKIQ